MAASPSGDCCRRRSVALTDRLYFSITSARPGWARLDPGVRHDVRLHPDIGLATVTYLLEGASMHFDSLNIPQRIEPCAIDWMTAGSCIE